MTYHFASEVILLVMENSRGRQEHGLTDIIRKPLYPWDDFVPCQNRSRNEQGLNKDYTPQPIEPQRPWLARIALLCANMTPPRTAKQPAALLPRRGCHPLRPQSTRRRRAALRGARVVAR